MKPGVSPEVLRYVLGAIGAVVAAISGAPDLNLRTILIAAGSALVGYVVTAPGSVKVSTLPLQLQDYVMTPKDSRPPLPPTLFPADETTDPLPPLRSVLNRADLGDE